MAKLKSQKGFTLIELMIAVAIIAILVAIAIPQYVKFCAKAYRAEAILIANGAHKSQTAYFATFDHYDRGGSVIAGPFYIASGTVAQDLNTSFGLPMGTGSFQFSTPHGYQYTWLFSTSSNASYELVLNAHLSTPSIYTDIVYMSVNGYEQVTNEAAFQCTSHCGWVDGIPFIFSDQILNKLNCPC